MTNRKRTASNLSVQIASDDAVQFQTAGRPHLDLPVSPTGLEDIKELLDVLHRRRDKFAEQVAFWERYEHNQWNDLVAYWASKDGLYNKTGLSLHFDDIELLLMVLRTMKAEYDHYIAILEAQMHDF